MTYNIFNPRTNKKKEFVTIADARKFAYYLIEQGYRKSVTIKDGNRNYAKVWKKGYGIVTRRINLYEPYYDEGKVWVLGPDGSLYREYDGWW